MLKSAFERAYGDEVDHAAGVTGRIYMREDVNMCGKRIDSNLSPASIRMFVPCFHVLGQLANAPEQFEFCTLISPL